MNVRFKTLSGASYRDPECGRVLGTPPAPPPAPHLADRGHLRVSGVSHLALLSSLLVLPLSLLDCNIILTFSWGLKSCRRTLCPNLPLLQSASTSFRKAQAILYQPPGSLESVKMLTCHHMLYLSVHSDCSFYWPLTLGGNR